MLQYNQAFNKNQWLIRLLEKRNDRIKTEIQNCKKVVLQQKERVEQSRQNSFAFFKDGQYTPESLKLYKKQLQNSYQHIKRFQTELKQENGRGDQHKKQLKYIQLLRQRKSMKPKIIQEIRKQQLRIRENSRSLSKKVEKGGDKTFQLTKQIEVLSKTLKSIQQENERKENQLKKQYQFIKRLQKELLNGGMDPQQIRNIRSKSIKFLKSVVSRQNTVATNQTQNSFQSLIRSRIRNRFNLIPSSPLKGSTTKDSSLSNSRTKIKIRLIQEKTVFINQQSGDYNRNIKKDVSLLQKVVNEDQQTISRLQKQIYNRKYQSIKTKNSIKEIDQQILKYENMIFELQKKQIS